MILQISSTVIRDSSLKEYLEYLRQGDIPSYEAAPGLVSVWLLQRPFVAYVEVMIISVWQSDEALKRFVANWTVDRATRECKGIQLEPRVYELDMYREGKLGNSEVK